jgi:hypothetical protein
MNGSRSILFSAALLSLATVSACSDATGTRRVPLSLSFATKSFAAKASVSSPSGFSADLIVGTGGDLVITSAQVVLDGIELSHDDGPNCEGTGEFHCEDVEQSAQLVDIPLTGVKTQLTVAVPEGSYQRLDAHIQVPESDDAGVTAFLAAHPEFKDVSVRVVGTYGPNKTPFTYTAPIDAKLELRFNPPLVVTSGSNNITVDVDVASWFKDSLGAALDPTAPANAARIAANIRASFNAFEDDNEDGQSDK